MNVGRNAKRSVVCKTRLISLHLASTTLGPTRLVSDFHFTPARTIVALRELDEEVEGGDEERDDADGADGDVHLRLGLEREAALAARGAALVLCPLAQGPVVDVPAALAHPELAVHLGERGVGLLALRRGGVSGGRRAGRRGSDADRDAGRSERADAAYVATRRWCRVGGVGTARGRTRGGEGETTSTSTRQGRGTNRGGGAVLLHADLAGVGLHGGEARGLGADAGGDANLRGDGAREGGQSAVVARVITWRLDGRRAGRNDHPVAFADAAARGRTWFTRVPREKAADLPAFTATGVVREAMADIVTDVTREVECARGGMLRTRQRG